MPNPPSTPNFVPGVGRLVTDRFDFQAHITGANFRHTASQIDLSPFVTIDGYVATTVQSAIATLATVVSPPIIAPATTTSQGIIQLAGDIGGNASTVRVTGLQGNPVSTLTPVTGYVLTWNGIAWAPSAASNAFAANGDLTGNNVLQNVISLSGLAGTVSVFCNNINFFPTLTPSITQTSTSIGNGANMTIAAQNSTNIGGAGGNVIISGGNSGSSGLRGGVLLKLANTINSSIPVQAVEVANGRRVLALLHPSNVTNVDMPAGTGDLVMYVRDTALAPSFGSPVNGTILYSTGGQLWIKQGDGNNFAIGSIPNPSIWGPTGQQSYTSRIYLTTTTNVPAQALNFAVPANTAVRVDAVLVGRATGSNDAAMFNLSMGYISNGSSLTAVGTVTSSDPRTTGGAVGWTLPNIIASSANVIVQTGCNTGTTIDWFVVTQLSLVN